MKDNICRVNVQIHNKTWKTNRYNARFFSVVYGAKGMKFCTQVARSCVHKRLVFDFHLFAKIGRKRREFQTVHKFQPINIRYLLKLHFFFNGSYQTCSSIQGTQITLESVFISRFTMNNIAPKLQKRWTHKFAFKIISKMLKQPNFF